MCHRVVIEYVKARALSRRDFFRASAAAGAAIADDAGKMHFPGFHVEAVQMLLEKAKVAGVGVDTLSIDYGISTDFITHYTWLPANRWAVENVANLDELPPVGATLVVGAPKHQGGTGGPCRLIALV